MLGIQGDEVPQVLEGLAMLLRARVESGEDLEGATVAFRAFYRLLMRRGERPNYTENVTWNTIVEWIKWYHLTRGG